MGWPSIFFPHPRPPRPGVIIRGHEAKSAKICHLANFRPAGLHASHLMVGHCPSVVFANMTPPTRNDCHQALLEGVSKLSLSESNQRTRMTEIFKKIISHYEPSQPEDGPYKHITLLNLTYEYVRSKESQDRFLKYFLESVKISVEDEFHFEAWDPERKSELASDLEACAEFLVNSFFLPSKLAFATD
jgi:hypothetical protein